MTLPLITEHFDLWTSTVRAKSTSGRGSNSKIELAGIKKLRELILELAVRGKLVPQNPDDEPASVLLSSIEAEKARLVAEGKLKKQKPLPPVSDEEKPFELPEGWEWSRLGICSADIHYGYTASANESLEDYRLLRITDIQNDKVDWSTVPGCEITSEQAESYLLKNNDILIARTGGTIGKSYLVQDLAVQSVFASYLIRVRKLDSIYAHYLKVFLGSQTYWTQLYAASMGTGQPNVNGNSLKNLALPLPPLAEQHRIVAKVDELMALCDQLEQQSEQQLDAHKQLVETLLESLTQCTGHAELVEAWQRLAAHFDLLFSGPMGEWAIDRLKDTILQLAVMGKLVPQNPEDEPASVLLARIEEEKARLVAEGKLKKQKPLPPVSDDEKPFELPEGWEWVHLLQISNEIGTGPFGSMIHKADYTSGGVPLINPSHMINDRVVEDPEVSVKESKAKELASYLLSAGDIVLARRGEVGRCALVTEREHGWLCGTGSFYLRLNSGISRLFMSLVFRVSSTRSYLMGNAVGTTMVNLNHGILNSLPVALPPIPEQCRIVTKVEEFFALCDQLKAKLQAASKTQLNLTEALVEQVSA